MANKRPKKYKPRNYETPSSNDIYFPMHHLLMSSPAFMDLKKGQQSLYMWMRHQIYACPALHEKTPKLKYKEEGLFQDNKYFFFSEYYWKTKYKLYTNKNQFYKDRDALIEHGFIRIASNGKMQKTQTVYEFTSNWQEWKVSE